MTSAAMKSIDAARPAGLAERGGLPRWTYFNTELLELEKHELFSRCWQLVGHVSDITEAGSYMCLDAAGERALVVRGHDGQVRAFHNVCRHRGSRVVADSQGKCKSALVCPFHGWSFNLDGTLKAVPRPRTLPALDPHEHGLIPLECEIWHGFVFVRFASSEQPPVHELMAVYEDEISAYRLEDMHPLDGPELDEIAVNWKSVRDVDNEGYHVPVAHPTLHDLYGKNYFDERHQGTVSRSEGRFDENNPRTWSVQQYLKHLPDVPHLPAEYQKRWTYFGLFPNTVIMLYPDSAGFYQEFPLGCGRTVQRSARYALNDNRREMRAARYLSYRIDRSTITEDIQLIEWSWEAMLSSGYNGVILSDLEAGVRDHHDLLRRMIPVFGEENQPAPGQVARRNAELKRHSAPMPWPNGK